MYKHTQRSFAGGRLDRALMGRQDLEKYFTGASEITNFLVQRQGNLAKRRGTDFAADLTGLLGYRSWDAETGYSGLKTIGEHRLLPLAVERERGYYILLADRRAFILDTARGIYCSDGSWRRSVAPYLAPAEGDASVSEDDFIILTPFTAKIGDRYYASLNAAAAAMSDGETIELGEDVELQSELTVKGTINLKGHTITMAASAAKIVFNPAVGVECGIVSGGDGSSEDAAVEIGAAIKWSDAVSQSSTVTAIQHTSGVMILRDIDIDCPSRSTTSCIVATASADPLDRVEIIRCTIRAAGGNGVVRLSGTCSQAAEWDAQYQCYKAGVRIVDCDIAYDRGSTSTNYRAISNSVTNNANARRTVFASGTLHSPNHPASNLGFFVQGGILDILSLGTSTTASIPVSKMERGLSTTVLIDAYIASGTVPAEDSGEPTRIEHKGLSLVSYAPTAEYPGGDYTNIAYTPEMASTTNPARKDTSAGTGEMPPEASSASLTEGEAPYCVATPLADCELATLDYFQSGDTVFLAHRQHSPARIVFDPDALTLLYSRLRFNAARWKPPLLVSAKEQVHIDSNTLQYSGSTKTVTSTRWNGRSKITTVSVNDVQKASTSTSLPARTVHYCVTYVKDGEESPPSNPLSVTYGAPWEEGGTIELEFTRGANAAEPDYYNIYKKESSIYGYIGSTSKPVSLTRSPAAYGYNQTENLAMQPGQTATATMDGRTIGAADREDILGGNPSDAFDGEALSPSGGFTPRAGCGGLRFGAASSALLEFGAESRIFADTVDIVFDSHTLAYETVTDAQSEDVGRVRVFDDMILSGASVTVTVMTQSASGEKRDLSVLAQTATLAPVEYTAVDGSVAQAQTGAVRRYCGTVAPDASKSAIASVASMPLRSLSFTFPALATADRQIVRVIASCRDASENACECVISGFTLRRSSGTETTFTDDYITPDMSLTPPSDEAAFSARGEYPSCVGIYQQRLVFAATSTRPFAFWMSAVGDLYTFAPHESIREDDAISAELAATEFPDINHLVFSRDLVMLADNGEWKVSPVSGNTLTYKTLSATLQSRIGSAKRIKPLAVGNEVIFAERTGGTLRSIIYNYASDGYESNDLTVLSGDIFAGNEILHMVYKQHPDSTIECVLADGTIAAMVYMREHEVAAWTRHVLGGGARALEIATNKAIASATTDIALVVARDGRTELWAVRPERAEQTVQAQVCLDGARTLSGADAAAQWERGWVAVDVLTAEVALLASDLDGARTYICGCPFEAELVTLRPEVPSQGTIQFEVKNAKSIEARILRGGSWRAAPYPLADDPLYAQRVDAPPSAADGTVSLDTSDHRLLLSGHNSGDGRVQIKSGDPWPLSILSLSSNYEIQPLSNSEG